MRAREASFCELVHASFCELVLTATGERMDDYDAVYEYISTGLYPEHYTKNDKNNLRRKARSFKVRSTPTLAYL